MNVITEYIFSFAYLPLQFFLIFKKKKKYVL